MTSKKWWLVYLFLSVLLIASAVSVSAKKNTLNVTITEAVSEKIAYNPEKGEYSTGNTSWNKSYALMAPSLVGIINITNVGTEALSNLNITLNGTTNLSAWPTLWSAPSYLTSVGGPVRRTSGSPGVGQDWWVYASVLKPGGSLIYNYTLNIASMEPVNVTETYSANKIIEGGSLTVNITVQNSVKTPVNIANVRIVKTPGRYYKQDGSSVYFNYTGVSGPEAGNVSFAPYDNVRKMLWNVSGLSTITPFYLSGKRSTILLTVQAPTGLNGTFPTTGKRWGNTTWGAYMLMGNLNINVTMQGSLSAMGIKSVLGTSTATIEVDKRRLNSTHWNTTAKFNNTAMSIDYNLTKITIWSTNYTAATFNPANSIAASISTATPNASISNGSSWVGISKAFAWSWVPVVWANASYKILDDGTQIKKIVETKTVSNGYVYVEEIFVLKGGYLIKVTKKIVPITNSRNDYNVTLLLENIGTEKTPDWVSTFDLIPPNFVLVKADDPTTPYANRNMSGAGTRYQVSQASQLRGVSSFAAIAAGTYTGYQGYRADFHELMNGSNGNGQYDNVASEVRFQYIINGTGSLSRVSNAFLVGVDPQRTDGEVSSVNAPDTNVQVSSGNDNLAEKTVMFVSLIIAIVALIAGFVLSRNTR